MTCDDVIVFKNGDGGNGVVRVGVVRVGVVRVVVVGVGGSSICLLDQIRFINICQSNVL